MSFRLSWEDLEFNFTFYYRIGGPLILEDPVCFKITEQSLKNLREVAVSPAVLDNLEGIKDQGVPGEKEFLEKLTATIGKEATVQYGSLILESAKEPFDLNGTSHRPWAQSELSRYVSNRFLSELILDHFHIDLDSRDCEISAVSDRRLTQVPQAKRKDFPDMKFEVECIESVRQYRSIGPVEVTVFRNGWMAVVVRIRLCKKQDPSLNMQNDNDTLIIAEDVLDLIRHPEHIFFDDSPPDDSPPEGLHPGKLLKAIWEKLPERIEPKLIEWLSRRGLLELTMESGERKKIVPPRLEDLKHNRTRPYVGVLFSLPVTEKHARRATDPKGELPVEEEPIPQPVLDMAGREEIEAKQMYTLLKRFIIGAGRATPSFLTDFVNPHRYLNELGRNAYGPGGSFLFIGSRGWCSFNSGQQNEVSFRLGVIELSHLVIMAVQTAALSRQHYALEVHRNGAKEFKELNRIVSRLVHEKMDPWIRNSWKELEVFRHQIAKCTSFLARARLVSPGEDLIDLLSTHLNSHTSRNSLNRVLYLTGLDGLSKETQETLKNYTEFLKTSAHYLDVQAYRMSRLALTGTVAMGLLSILTAVVIFLNS